MTSRPPIVSVVTVCLNAAPTIERTILAVLGQSYPNVEYILIDGGSTDETLDVIRKYESRIAVWSSGKDAGIADAFNKGVRKATGKYFCLVNADDWPEINNLRFAVEVLEARPEVAFVFGDLLIHRGGRLAYRHDGVPDYRKSFGLSMGSLNHPTVVCRHDLFDRIGLFDTDYRIAMDFDWLLRLHAAGYSGIYDPRIQGHMETGGVSVKQVFRALWETRAAALAAGLPPGRVHCRYWLACAKARLRLLVESHLSHGASQWLRQRLFRSLTVVLPKKDG
jgi:glycosyltransferase involved in cell wall biosynthesis